MTGRYDRLVLDILKDGEVHGHAELLDRTGLSVSQLRMVLSSLIRFRMA